MFEQTINLTLWGKDENNPLYKGKGTIQKGGLVLIEFGEYSLFIEKEDFLKAIKKI